MEIIRLAAAAFDEYGYVFVYHGKPRIHFLHPTLDSLLVIKKYYGGSILRKPIQGKRLLQMTIGACSRLIPDILPYVQNAVKKQKLQTALEFCNA